MLYIAIISLPLHLHGRINFGPGADKEKVNIVHSNCPGDFISRSITQSLGKNKYGVW